jgi:hypothetical protein
MRAHRKELGHEDIKVAALPSGEKTSVTKSDNLMRQQTDQLRPIPGEARCLPIGKPANVSAVKSS